MLNYHAALNGQYDYYCSLHFTIMEDFQWDLNDNSLDALDQLDLDDISMHLSDIADNTDEIVDLLADFL